MNNELIIKVNQELEKLYNYILENEDAFKSMNLKLYDAAYKASDLLKEYQELEKNYYGVAAIFN